MRWTTTAAPRTRGKALLPVTGVSRVMVLSPVLRSDLEQPWDVVRSERVQCSRNQTDST